MNRDRLLALLPPTFGAAIFGVAIWVLRRELASFHLADIEAQIASIPGGALWAAAALTVLGYVVLTGYDALAFRWIANPLSYPRIALASFTGFVFSHNIGLSFLGGNAVRYRILSSFGVEPPAIARVVAFNLITFWLGFLLLGGVALCADPIALPRELAAYVATTRPIGMALLGLLAAYGALAHLRRGPISIGAFELTLPRPVWSAAQLALSAIDWALAASVLFVLLPAAPGLSFERVLGAYLLAQVIALVSHVPGGLGVFEGVIVLLLRPYLSSHVVLGSVVAYRLIYYVAPLVLAVLLLGGFELAQRRRWLDASRSALERWLPEVVPRFLSLGVLVAGIVLLLSGATPASQGRFALLSRLLPLPAIEVSHLLGSVIGVGLLLLARALQQRIDAGYFLALAGLGTGAIVSLAKGLDWEEASLLALMGLALLPCRRFFYRRSSLLAESFSPDWTVGVALALVGTLVLTLFAHRHVEYSHDLWWQFEVEGHAPRSLRALLGASLTLLAFALVRLLKPAPPSVALPDAAALDRLRPLVDASPSSDAHLVLLGDKFVLPLEADRGFVMYGVEGHSWIAMGDPVGGADARRELAWRFRELADAHGGRASFYEVSERDLPVYLDLGMSLRKLGEEAIVPLAHFTLEGSKRSRLRNARNRMLREGCHFEVLPATAVPALLDELEGISRAWLERKHTREKRFSLGCFDRAYLARTPLAVIRRAGQTLAFANVWQSGEQRELSIDLMRFGPEAPPATMDALFTELMLWGRERGYAQFSLGMAPLSGFQQRRLAPLWTRLGALLFRYGEHFYNFQGLREFKEKFDPDWHPRYLAAPDALSVPLVLTRVAALVNAGISGVVKH